VVAITALDVLWATREERPPHWDMGHHLYNSLVYEHLTLAHPLRFLETYLYYPPAVYWVTDVFYAVLGNDALWVAELSNVVFIAILVFSTYGLGSRLWSRRVGTLAAVFVVTTPMLVTAFKEYMLDAPLTAMVALALYLLVAGDRFASRGYSIALGAACGLGLLAKWTFLPVVALPIGVVAVGAVIAAVHEARPRRVLNVAWAVVVTVLIAVSWYGHNGITLLAAFRHYNVPQGAGPGTSHVLSVSSAGWYLWNLVGNQLYLIPSLFLGAGIVFMFLRREQARQNLVPILTIAGTYVFLSLLRDKDERFGDPMLPAVAIIATSWLTFVGSRARAWLSGVIAVYGAVAFLSISFGTGLLPKSVVVHTGASPFGGVTLFGQHGYIIGPPTSEDWHQQEVVSTIAAAPPPQRSFSYRGPDTIWFNAWGLHYYALRYGARFLDRPQGAGFLLVRGRPGAIPASFTRIRSYTLPDGGTLGLYRRG
jgi:4-amino-4-deoxy-L-arabinose transferase-like glycosyltransferase